MKEQIKHLSRLIKDTTKSNDKTAFIFFGYYTLYSYQLMLSEHLLNEESRVYLQKNLDNNCSEIIVQDFDSLQSLLHNSLMTYTFLFGEKIAKNIERDWNNLGLKNIEQEAVLNKKGVNKIIDSFNEVDRLNLQDLGDLYKILNLNDISLNTRSATKPISSSNRLSILSEIRIPVRGI